MLKLNITKVFVFLIPVLLCVFAAIFFGKDVNFDAINYHGYAAFGLLNERLWVDFFPAGPQSYLNPLGYLPFYFLSSFFGDAGGSIGLAVLHSSCIYGVAFVAGLLIDRRNSPISYWFAIVTSLMTVVFWQNVGSSFIDAYICALVIFGLGFLLRWIDSKDGSDDIKALAVSAFLFGLAVGLKLTSIIFAVSATVVFFSSLFFYGWKWKDFFIFAFLGFLGFLITQGWWGYLVYERTGNPFFPYFNHVFKSAFLPSEAILNTRFIPESFMDGALFPIKAILPLPWLYQELRAPDIRWVVFFFALVVTVGGVLKKFIVINRIGWGAIIFFLLSYVLWLLSSGNGRYAMPIFLLVGILGVWLLSLFIKGMVLRSVLLVLLLTQSILVFLGGNLRWSEGEFSGSWFDYNIPEELIDKPALYFSIDHNSYSFLAEKVNPSSIFINVSGQLSLPYTPDLDKVFQRSMNKVNGNVRIITTALLTVDRTAENQFLPTYNDYYLRPRLIYVLNARLSRFGFEVDNKSCLFVSPNTNDPKKAAGLLVSCRLIKKPSALIKYREVVQNADVVFSLVENTCRNFFSPMSAVTELHGDLLMRNYVGSEAMLYLSKGVVWISFSDRIGVKRLGEFEKLASGMAKIDCNNELVRVSDDIY